MPQHGTNGFDGKRLNGYLSEIDVNDIEIERLKDDCKNECAPYKEQIADIMTAVKDSGINMAAFKVVLAEHRAEKKIDRQIAALDMADRADYGAMVDALGVLADTPLGEAALGRTLKPGETIEIVAGNKVSMAQPNPMGPTRERARCGRIHAGAWADCRRFVAADCACQAAGRTEGTGAID